VDPDLAPTSPAQAAFTWRANNTLRDLLTDACPTRTPSRDCAANLRAQLDAKPSLDPHRVIAQIAAPSYAAYLRKHSIMVGLLHAARVELALGARTRRTRACPTPADAADPELAPLLVASSLGAPLTLAAGADDELRITSDLTLDGKPLPQPYVLGRVACKDGALIAPSPMLGVAP
jgi:hypothetical protein